MSMSVNLENAISKATVVKFLTELKVSIYIFDIKIFIYI